MTVPPSSPGTMPGHICVQWPRLGPYHIARLRALHALLGASNVRLTALETSRADATYAWREEEDEVPFHRAVALDGQAPEHTPPSETRRAITLALDRIAPDAVAITSYSTPDALAALTWCRRHRRTAVLLFDSRAEDASRMAWRETVKRVLVSQYDAALVAGTPQCDYLVSLGMSREAVFTPLDVVDNRYFSEGAQAARQLGLSPAPAPYFLSINRFLPRKNIDGLLRAYAMYRERTSAPPWPLVLLGDGPERLDLERLAGPGVHFGGFTQVEELPRWYAFAGAFVHPAHVDQWGLVVNEAMAAGLPVIVSTGAGCAPDLVRDGYNGHTFDPMDEHRLACLLGQIAANPEGRDRMGAQSYSRISQFSPEAFADGLWNAVQHGSQQSDRTLSLAARLALTAHGLVARSYHAFHTVEA